MRKQGNNPTFTLTYRDKVYQLDSFVQLEEPFRHVLVRIYTYQNEADINHLKGQTRSNESHDFRIDIGDDTIFGEGILDWVRDKPDVTRYSEFRFTKLQHMATANRRRQNAWYD